MNASDTPVGQYQPEFLLLAPSGGESATTLSLVSQCLELGLPIELDHNWRVPTVPPKDLSAYRGLMLPETFQKEYPAEATSLLRHPNYAYNVVYYPVEQPGTPWSPFERIGRDLYAWNAVSTMSIYNNPASARSNRREFRWTLQQRTVRSLARDARQSYFQNFDSYSRGSRKWGDPVYTLLKASVRLAKVLQDKAWLDLVDTAIAAIGNMVDGAVASDNPESGLQIDRGFGRGSVQFALMAHVLMTRGVALNNRTLTEQGMKLMQAFVPAAEARGGAHCEKTTGVWLSETLFPLPGLYWLAKLTGDAAFRKVADECFTRAGDLTQDANGLWHHWVDERLGEKGAFWSRAQFWPLLWMTESLPALGSSDERVARLMARIRKTLDALRRFQDTETGLWHLVIDDPATRLESTATIGVVYCHDRLRELGLLDDAYAEMCAHAFAGLKAVHYFGGLGLGCRGTAMGNASYYRTRPMGYYNMSLFPAVLAERLGATVPVSVSL